MMVIDGELLVALIVMVEFVSVDLGKLVWESRMPSASTSRAEQVVR